MDIACRRYAASDKSTGSTAFNYATCSHTAFDDAAFNYAAAANHRSGNTTATSTSYGAADACASAHAAGSFLNIPSAAREPYFLPLR